MKSHLLLSGLGCTLALAGGPVHAQAWRTGDLGLKAAVAATEAPPTRSRVGLSYRPAFNVTVRFNGLGGAAPLPGTDPGPLNGGPFDRIYDDGYNRPDTTLPSDGLTWYWGYREANQISDGYLLLSRSSALPDGSSTRQADGPQHGLELSYRYQLWAGPRLRAGWEGAFGLTHVSVADSAAVSSSVHKLTDAYDLGGIIPPQPPYEGTYFGPGPLIADTPTWRQERRLPGVARTTGLRQVDAWVYGLRLGPYLEVPVVPRLAFSFSGGCALAVADSEFQYAHLTQLPGRDPVSQTGQTRTTRARVGGFVAAGLAWSVARDIDLFAGAQYQRLGRMRQQTGPAQVELDLRNPVFFCVGAGFHF